jgi:hypothetical protein
MFDDELAAIPTQPPRTGVLPGMRIGAAVPKSTLLLLLAFFVLITALPLSIISTDPKMRLGIGPSGMAQGRVLATATVSSCRNSAAHRIIYSFSPQSGNEFRGAGLLCEVSPYYSAQADDKIEIRYLKRDPAVNSIAGTASDNEPPIFIFLLFPFFFLLLLSALFLPQIREVMYARRLYRAAVLTEGKVVFVKKRSGVNWPGWPGSSTAEVYVAHQLPSGGRAEAIVRCTNDWLVNQLVPGATVHILLPRDKSKRGALLQEYIR